VIYVGDIWQPSEELSAVAIDKKNEEAEKHLQQQTQKTAEETAKNSSYDQYRSKVKGEDKIRYLPEFEAVR
jgi:outer membrane protein assembly factor BamE